jgi:hypothetical protein
MTDSHFSNIAAALALSGMRNRQQTRIFHIINAYNPGVASNMPSQGNQSVHNISICVVGAKEGIRPVLFRMVLEASRSYADQPSRIL